MASGRPVTMTTKTGERPMTIETLSAPQINGLLQEIMPAGQAAAAGGQDSRFEYHSPFGKIAIHVTHAEGQATITLTPVAGGEAKLAAATPSPQAAPPSRPAAPEPERAAAPPPAAPAKPRVTAP